MNTQNIFDEFGNVISEEEIREEKDIFDIEEVEDEVSNYQYQNDLNIDYEQKIEQDRDLYENQQEYLDQEEIYKNGEYYYQDEDEQDLNQPIIQTIEKQNYYIEQNKPINFESEFFCQLQKQIKDFRNIGVFGNYQSGKTKLIDMLINSQTNFEFLKLNKKQSNFWQIEQDKKMTIFSKPISIITEAFDNKNYLLTIFDTPGHTDLYDETTCIMQSIDSAIFVIDAIEGLTMHSKQILNDLQKQKIPIIYVINKLDRFIQEMRIQPEDQYLILEQLVYEIEQNDGDLNHNIFFSSFKLNFIFSLKDFYDIYLKDIIDVDIYSDILFGECFWNQQLQQFNDSQDEGFERTFVFFILNPIYKIFSTCVSNNLDELQHFLNQLQIDNLQKELKDLELKILIKTIYQKKFYFIKTFNDCLINNTPLSSVKNKSLLQQYFSNTNNEFIIPETILQVIKFEPMFEKDEKKINKFNTLVRILKGNIKQNQTQLYSQKINIIQSTIQGDQKINIENAYEGNIVLLTNIDIENNQQILSNIELSIDIKNQYQNGSFFKLSLEPFQPNKMNIFVNSLQKLQKLIKGIKIKTQDTGEYQLLGRGEVQLDIALYFLREVLEIQEIRISDPFVQFSESILQTSQVMPEVKTINKKNTFQFLAEPLSQILIDNFQYLKNLDSKQRRYELKEKFQIDQFTINSLWSFNQQSDHPSIFSEQSLLTRAQKKNILQYKELIVQGFQWAISKGPLCSEPIRDCELKLINFEIEEDQLQASQIIPLIQKGIHSAILLAQPCIKEPIYKFEIITIKEALTTVYNIIKKRRGQIYNEKQVLGFGYIKLNGQIPILDSFGLETDIKIQTLGQAQISKIFSKWEIVPGDPLNTKIKIKKLQPSEPQSLARDILLKTRRKKGLTDEISLLKFFNTEKDIISLVQN